MGTLEQYGKPTRLVYYVEARAKELQTTLATLNSSLPSSAVAYSVNGTVIESLQKTLKTQSAFFFAMALFSFLTAILMIGNQVVISLLQKKGMWPFLIRSAGPLFASCAPSWPKN
ncbi:hypothetical protein EHV15_32405 [Paenibacillus oralis]|uniref:Uncharacterized protein n=1 Tax=Paenibacillus oralis TaxID=2490856 RepID=A0A3P3UAE0_9BACL|nr:hypothetical protein [Paenibacillus oralis]RRJ67104.1 hypothetical protein EHV15_32405 [Paenibacillus oralis]